MLKPVGFWSYTRQDDAHSDGQLSQLRLLIGKAIGLRQGEEVRFFQDTEAIPFGADWAADIERSISDVTFFIAVVTPAFLRSKHCCDEFRAFRRRMVELGRDDLIFPIHYVDIDKFDPTESVFGEDFAALRRSNWIDFRPLYFDELKSSQVKQWADRLAVSILAAMWREASQRQPIGTARARTYENTIKIGPLDVSTTSRTEDSSSRSNSAGSEFNPLGGGLA
jgi:TIR domain